MPQLIETAANLMPLDPLRRDQDSANVSPRDTRPTMESIFEKLGIPVSDGASSIATPPKAKNLVEIEIPRPTRAADLSCDEGDEFEALAKLIRDEVRSLKKQVRGSSRPLNLLLSHRQAARLLRIDRGTTLRALIESGQIRTVKVNGRTRIPWEEVARLAEEGFDLSKAPTNHRRKRKRRKVRASDAETAIRKIKL